MQARHRQANDFVPKADVADVGSHESGALEIKVDESLDFRAIELAPFHIDEEGATQGSVLPATDRLGRREDGTAAVFFVLVVDGDESQTIFVFSVVRETEVAEGIFVCCDQRGQLIVVFTALVVAATRSCLAYYRFSKKIESTRR